MSEGDKYQCQVTVTKEFINRYFKPSKDKTQLVPGKIAKLLRGLNSVVSIEENSDCCDQQPVVVIEADTESHLQQAQMKVTQALLALTTRSSFTHLITFPFTEPTLVASYQHFKDTVLSTFADREGIDESLFQNAKKLHCTVSVLTLVSDEHLSKAKQILQHECATIVQSGLDLSSNILVKGLGIMNDDPSRANVLYAKVEDERLQMVADKLAQQMMTNSLVFKDQHAGQPVKLHITLMNTVFANRKNRKRKLEKPIKRVKHFDCASILEHFKDHVFADIAMPSVQLNDVRAESEVGYYRVVDSFELSPQISPKTDHP